MSQLEVALLVGKESKEWLMRVEKALARMEQLAKVDESEGVETAAGNDDDEDFAETKSVHKRTANGFDDEAEDEVPLKKKAKKITADDVNDACKAKALEEGGGKEGRAAVLNILKKKFKTASVSELEPDQYAAVIAAMKA